MKYKVGDIVTVRRDLEEGEKHDGTWVVEDMLKYRGKQLTIRRIYKSDGYDVYGNGWLWCDWMFEDHTKELKEYITKLCESVQK